jgi:hypothetical protein
MFRSVGLLYVPHLRSVLLNWAALLSVSRDEERDHNHSQHFFVVTIRDVEA